MKSEISYAVASQSYRAGQYTQALATLNRLLDLRPDARTYALLGKTLLQLGFKDDAAGAYLLASEQNGADAQDYLVEAIKLHFALGNKDQTLALGSRLTAASRKNPEIAFIIASLLLDKGQIRLSRVFKDVLMKSDTIEHMQLGARISLHTWDVFDPDDIETARVLLSRLPRNNRVRMTYLAFCREHSKFDSMAVHQPIIDAALAAGDLSFAKHDVPFFNIHWTGDESLNQLARDNTPTMPEDATQKRRAMPHAWGEKIRVGYVSSDFFDRHATMKLVRRVLELHDRDRFEVTLFCHTDPELLILNDADRSAWGNVVSIRDMNNLQAREEIRRHEIDILVDLKGHTAGNRTAIFNLGGAPIQVAWLGFPGSMVNIDVDYAIGDPTVLPDSSAPFYREKFCRLPESYQPNDPINRPVSRPKTKAQVGLPEDAFVFASFNANRKITVPMIEMWAAILKRTPNSVIWILRNNAQSQTYIQQKLIACGIPARRIFFMQKMDFDIHINRIPTADLGLDTFPVNGHTTTSEQLWAGLPVLTVKGTNFASRVSESLLNAIGLPELVAETNADYVETAVSLCQNPAALAAYRQRLVDNRFTHPLFDADRLRIHLEAGYETMYARAKAGLEPDHFDVPAQPPREGSFLEA